MQTADDMQLSAAFVKHAARDMFRVWDQAIAVCMEHGDFGFAGARAIWASGLDRLARFCARVSLGEAQCYAQLARQAQAALDEYAGQSPFALESDNGKKLRRMKEGVLTLSFSSDIFWKRIPSKEGSVKSLAALREAMKG